MSDDRKIDRRSFLRSGTRAVCGVAVVGAMGGLAARGNSDGLVWQIDPEKCIACGKCATACVLTPSAAKVVHEMPICGFCDLCFGYFAEQRPGDSETAENLRCPTDAIIRNYVEEPYYDYMVNEPKCIGCAICVEGCRQYGNGALVMQVRHDRCVNCNECAIAVECPADAFERVPATSPYLLRSLDREDDDVDEKPEEAQQPPSRPEPARETPAEAEFEPEYEPDDLSPLEMPPDDHDDYYIDEDWVDPEPVPDAPADEEDADDLLDLLGVDLI